MSKRNDLIIPAGCEPQAAILILKDEFLLVSREDKQVQQKYLSPGALRQAFAAEPIDSGWIPSGVRRWGVSPKGTWMLRWSRPMAWPVWLPGRKRQAQIPFPALVFFAQGSKYYLWAMKGKRFDPKGALFNAPCANVSGLGLICWGENPHPDVATGCFERMWSTFWEAPFSPNWADGKSRKYPKSANERLADLAKRRAKAYPEDDLMPLRHRLLSKEATLEAMVEMMVMRGGQNSWE